MNVNYVGQSLLPTRVEQNIVDGDDANGSLMNAIDTALAD